jgi:tRNA U34 5-methylaminomethyl-2-thiouridine-forming methyltransferase MnmC
VIANYLNFIHYSKPDMERKMFLTEDGSHSISIPGQEVSYHSKYGAIQESNHVFIQSGLIAQLSVHAELVIFEMGFGTGLNALLTLIESEKEKKKIYYRAIEAFPLESSFVGRINYCSWLKRPDLQSVFYQFHDCEWEKDIAITPHFTLYKIKTDFIEYTPDESVNIIYYDAFAPVAQPELWTAAVFMKLFSMLLPGGILLTYCSKGAVQRAMKAAGFTVEKLPGPPHKREIIRARKI